MRNAWNQQILHTLPLPVTEPDSSDAYLCGLALCEPQRDQGAQSLKLISACSVNFMTIQKCASLPIQQANRHRFACEKHHMPFR